MPASTGPACWNRLPWRISIALALNVRRDRPGPDFRARHARGEVRPRRQSFLAHNSNSFGFFFFFFCWGAHIHRLAQREHYGIATRAEQVGGGRAPGERDPPAPSVAGLVGRPVAMRRRGRFMCLFRITTGRLLTGADAGRAIGMHTTSDPGRGLCSGRDAGGGGPDSSNPESVLQMPISIRGLALLVIAALATIYMVREMRDVLVPIALGVVVFHSLAPFVERLVRWHVPRTLAALLVMGVMIGGCRRWCGTLYDEAVAVVQQLPDAAKKLRGVFAASDSSPARRSHSRCSRRRPSSRPRPRKRWGPRRAARCHARADRASRCLRGSDVLLGGARNVT